MYNVSEQAVPTQYPLGINGLGTSTLNAPNAAAYAKRVNDLDSFGLITPAEKVLVGQLIQAGKFKNADMILAEKEKAALGKPESFQWKFGPSDELLKGVPNMYIYGGVALLLLARLFKKRS